ncbi:MAG: alpha-L-fucosidase [Bacteroidetes bacterium]|nr:alpha-L-fucosidase [Bacteroidota bacterium]
MLRFLVPVCSLLVMTITTNAQQHYIPPADSLVIKKLSQWQDWKFGLLMHWGTYSQWGVVESWSICPEDEGWTQRKPEHGTTYNAYKTNYENLQHSFNPTQFDPDKWAAAAQYAGMKYVVFTTKHHDGFCMFDTKQTDYKITSTATPFSSNPKSNVAKEIFKSFRAKGFATGAYFSKPDWHIDNYWWPYFPPKDRNVNYDPAKYPQRWQAFKDFTYNQIKELMNGDYGKMDILWLDGGWVRPKYTIDTAIEWQRTIPYNQDIDMAKIAGMARSYQPGLLVVDRSVGYEYENYVTPEQEIPNKLLPYPWETCMTMATSWSYVPHDHYKSTNELIHTLVKIVGTGGNLLLNIGPDANGEWDTAAYNRLKEIGDWMKINSEAIYNTRALPGWANNEVYFTMAKDSSAGYVLLFLKEGQQELAAGTIPIPDHFNGRFKHAQVLGTKTKLNLQKMTMKNNDDAQLLLPIKEHFSCSGLKHAIVFKLTR